MFELNSYIRKSIQLHRKIDLIVVDLKMEITDDQGIKISMNFWDELL